MAKLTDELRTVIALRAAAYMRWVEVRKRRTPGNNERAEWIRGMLEAEELPCALDDIYAIDVVALTLNVDGVEEFVRESKFFEQMDAVQAQLDRQNKSPR